MTEQPQDSTLIQLTIRLATRDTSRKKLALVLLAVLLLAVIVFLIIRQGEWPDLLLRITENITPVTELLA